MTPADLELFNKLIGELSALSDRSRQSYYAALHTKDPDVARKRALVGLSVGAFEEVADANYKRIEASFAYDPVSCKWFNEEPIMFPVATALYGCDAVIIDGLDIQKRIVSRMKNAVMVAEGNGVGFGARSLAIEHDVMARACQLQPAQAPERSSAYKRVEDDVADQLAAHMRAHDELVKRFEANKARALELLGQNGLSHPAAPDTGKPEPERALHCERCETMSIARRNQLVSMGHSVSHLVELPDEAGYAVPCPSCRQR